MEIEFVSQAQEKSKSCLKDGRKKQKQCNQRELHFHGKMPFASGLEVSIVRAISREYELLRPYRQGKRKG